MKKTVTLLLSLLFMVIMSGAGDMSSAGRYVVAVFDFRNDSGLPAYQYLEKALPEMFATNLAQSPEITVLERERQEKILKEHGLAMAGITAGDTLKIGKLLSARQILSGSLISAGGAFRIDVRMTDVETGRILLAGKRQFKSAADIIEAVDALSEEIVRKVTGKAPGTGGDVEKVPLPPRKGDLVTLEVLPQNAYHPAGSGEPFYFRAGFYAAEYKSGRERLPLNIAVVLDRSGSMSDEGKLGYAKEAIKFLLRHMTKRDIFSLVLYDDRVDVAIAPVQVGDRRKLFEIVDGIKDRGSTNLSGGMLEGYYQVSKNLKKGQVNRVFLISDGLANVGVTDPAMIQRIAREKSREGISISTFGVGKYFNEILMTGISEYGQGNYYYIGKPEKIPEIFTREMEGLLSVVAQNCRLRFVPAGGTVLQNVYGYSHEREGEGISVKLGDLVSEEKKLALLSVKPFPRNRGTWTMGRVILSYDDVVSGRGRVERSFPVTLGFSGDKALIKANENTAILKDISMYRSAELMEKAMNLVDKGDYDKARSMLKDNLRGVQRDLRRYNSRDLKKQALNIYEYQQRLEAVEKSPADSKSEAFQDLQKSGRNKQYEIRKRK